MLELIESSAFGAALVFGFRHGFDWDHIAALTDLTGSQQSRRRSMVLATLYALGHAAMVLVLGLAAILFAEQIPSSVDHLMELFVGVTLVVLGLYIAGTVARTREPVFRSRWMLVILAVRRLTNGLRRAEAPVVIEHSHPHDHGSHMHGHDHDVVPVPPSEARARATAITDVAVLHSHVHRHVARAPQDPFIAYGNVSSFGIGLLHGIGAETPTQVLIFAAAANASDNPTSVGLLVCFIVGVLGANTVVAAASTFGFGGMARKRVVATVLSIAAATFSIVLGLVFLLGRSAVLPAILGG